MSTNATQSVRSEKGTIELKHVFKQISVLFKIYSDFECILDIVKSHEILAQKNIKITFFVVFLKNLFVLMMNLASQLLFLEVKMWLKNLLKQFLKSMNIVEK